MTTGATVLENCFAERLTDIVPVDRKTQGMTLSTEQTKSGEEESYFSGEDFHSFLLIVVGRSGRKLIQPLNVNQGRCRKGESHGIQPNFKLRKSAGTYADAESTYAEGSNEGCASLESPRRSAHIRAVMYPFKENKSSEGGKRNSTESRGRRDLTGGSAEAHCWFNAAAFSLDCISSAFLSQLRLQETPNTLLNRRSALFSPRVPDGLAIRQPI